MRRALIVVAAFVTVAVPAASIPGNVFGSDARIVDDGVRLDGGGEFVTEIVDNDPRIYGVAVNVTSGTVDVLLEFSGSDFKYVDARVRRELNGPGSYTIPAPEGTEDMEQARVVIQHVDGDARTTFPAPIHEPIEGAGQGGGLVPTYAGPAVAVFVGAFVLLIAIAAYRARGGL